MSAWVFDKCAVVTGQVTVGGAYFKDVYDGAYRFRDTFVWREGRWHLVASQNTSLPKS